MILKEHHVPQGSPEWKALRRQHACASESAMVMRVSPFGGPLDVWRLKMGDEKVQFDHPAILRGQELEWAALSRYEDRTGRMMQSRVLSRGLLLASLDGRDVLDAKHGCEIKIPTADSDTWAYAEQGLVPIYYMIQMQHQYLVAGLETHDFIVWEPLEENGRVLLDEDGVPRTARMKIIPVRPDPVIQQQIVEAWDEFWPFVEGRVEPCAVVDRKDAAWDKAAMNYLGALSVLREAEKGVAKAEAQLKKLAGKIISKTSGCGVTVRRTLRKGPIDGEALARAHGVNPEPFRLPAEEVVTVKPTAVEPKDET